MQETKTTEKLIICNEIQMGRIMFYFRTLKPLRDPIAAFEEAIHDYASSAEGGDFPRSLDGDFGWAQAIESIPASVWEKHGLELYDGGDCLVADYGDWDSERFERIIDGQIKPWCLCLESDPEFSGDTGTKPKTKT